MRLKTTLAVTAAALLLFAGCSRPELRDLEGVALTEPDKVRMVTNVEIVALCINGVGFVTTTRDNNAAFQESPGLTKIWCAQ